MKFLADQCFFIDATRKLRTLGFDVVTASELGLRFAEDESILDTARRENRILLTLDNDFGDINRFPLGTYPGIILLRLKPLIIETVNPVLESFLRSHKPEVLSKALVVITNTKTRISKAGQPTRTLNT